VIASAAATTSAMRAQPMIIFPGVGYGIDYRSARRAHLKHKLSAPRTR
jgi:hypothetical protein